MNSNLDLEIRRVLNAPIDQVWAAWADPENLKHWFCPLPWTVPVAEMDLRPGGRFRTVMAGPNGERSDNTGVFLEVVPNQRITFTDSLTEDYRPSGGGFMTARISFIDLGNGTTEYRAHVLHPNEETRKQHEEMGFHEGWGKVADQLEAFARSLG